MRISGLEADPGSNLEKKQFFSSSCGSSLSSWDGFLIKKSTVARKIGGLTNLLIIVTNLFDYILSYYTAFNCGTKSSCVLNILWDSILIVFSSIGNQPYCGI